MARRVYTLHPEWIGYAYALYLGIRFVYETTIKVRAAMN